MGDLKVFKKKERKSKTKKKKTERGKGTVSQGWRKGGGWR
jgi:hypothetical protein